MLQDTGLKKLIFVEMEEYPGFFDTPCLLPQKVETHAILKIVTSAIKITEKVCAMLFGTLFVLIVYGLAQAVFHER